MLLDSLSKSEQNIFEMLSKGLSNKQIAERVFVHDKTIKFHLTNIYKKLDLKNRSEAIAYFHNNLYKKGEEKVGYVERLPSQKDSELEIKTNNIPQKTQEERIKFVNENFGVSKTINQLQSMMTEVVAKDLSPNSVNAACNCVARLNETIDVAIKAARFLNER